MKNCYVVSSTNHDDVYGVFQTLNGAVGFVGEIMAEHNTTGVEILPCAVYDRVWYATFNDTGETFKIEEFELEN